MDTPSWVTDAVFYQIFPDRFAKSRRISRAGLNLEGWDSPPSVHGIKGGDLYGVLEHLDHLLELGINAIYLTPIFASASNHRYHTYDYYNVDPMLGGNAAFRELLDAAHRHGIRIVLDGVFNHASRGFWQFHHTLENGADSPYVNWFHFDPDRLARRRHWGAYPSPEEEQAIRDEGSLKAIGYQGWWDLPALPKFNTESPEVREFLFGVAEHWAEFGIDGWRLDVPAEIKDDSFWREFRRRVRSINPEAYIVGEIWHDARRWLQGDQFDACTNYLLTAACLSFFPGPQLDMATVRHVGGFRENVDPTDARGFAERIDWLLGLYPNDVNRVQLNPLDSHDTARFLTSSRGDVASLKLAQTFLFSFPGAPCLFYGDEIGLEGGNDPDCRRSFVWQNRTWNQEILDFTKNLVALRHNRRDWRWGSFRRLHADSHVYAHERRLDAQRSVTALNVGQNAREIVLDMELERGASASVISGQAHILGTSPLVLQLPPRAAAIVDLVVPAKSA